MSRAKIKKSFKEMKQLLLILKVILANWRKTKGQLIFTILGIAIASTLWSSIDIINNQTIKAQKRSIELFQSSFKPIIIDRELPFVSQKDYVKLRLDGWLVNPVIKATLQNSNVTVLGIDFLADDRNKLTGQKNLGDRNFWEMLADGNDLIFGSSKTFEKTKGLLSDFSRIENEQLPANSLIADISSVQRLLDMEGKFTYLEYVNRSLGSPDKLTLKNLMLIDDNSAGEFEFISESFTFNIRAFAFLSFFVGMFIVYTSIGMAYDQRNLTIKILKVIGVERKLINLCLTIELLTIALFSGSLGAFGGFLLAQELLPDINNTVSTLYNSPVDGKIDLSISWFIYSILIAGLGTLIACSKAIFKLDNLKPIESTNGGKMYRQKKNPIFVLAILLLLIYVFYYFSVSSNIKTANFLFLGSIIMMGCISLPILIRLVLSFAASNIPRNYTLCFWLIRDTQKFGTLLIAGYIAFFLALSINIGVHGMVTSFKTTFVEWLDNRIFADYYINVTNRDKLNEIKSLVEKYDGEVYPIIRNEGRFGTNPIEIYGFKPSIAYQENWPLLMHTKNAWNDMRNGEIIFVSEQFSIREKIKLDDFLELEINDKKLTARVGGIYADYGNSRNQLMMQLDLYNTFFSSQIPNTIAVKFDATNRLNFFNELTSNVEMISEAIINPQQVRNISLEIFDNTFKISYQLALITLLVASFTLYTNLVSVNRLRKKDLLPIYLIGFSSNQVLRLELLKIFILTNMVSFFSIGMGVIIAFILSVVINPNFFGWSIPIQVFPDYWLQTWLIALAASVFSTLLSLRSSSVKPISNFDVRNF
ncbi:MAG: FtsX-like permease family protein [Paracoccaceae bacterium]